MQTSSSNQLFRNVVPFMILGICLAVLILNFALASFARTQSSQVANQGPSQDRLPSPTNKYFFSDETPDGDWSGQAVFDIAQTHDSRVPVVIAGIRSYAGKGEWRKQVMIESAVLNNHTSKPISRIKFGWAIMTEQVFKAGENLDAYQFHARIFVSTIPDSLTILG